MCKTNVIYLIRSFLSVTFISEDGLFSNLFPIWILQLKLYEYI
jgi:hypothetical protein